MCMVLSQDGNKAARQSLCVMCTVISEDGNEAEVQL